jgi:MFS superfamily sulfate permease-like transporter
MLGALPMTGVIVRSSANIEAGGTTRLSAILHGVWLLAVVAAAPWLLERIPTASLAAILVYTGYKLVDVKKIKEVSRFGTVDLGIYFVTLTTIVASDLLHGVIVGFATSAAWLLVKLTSLGVSAEAAADDDVWIDVRLVGAATFINLPQLAMEIENIPAGKSVRIDHRHLTYIDHAAVNLLRNWQRQHEAKGGKVISPDWEVVAAHTARGAAARDLSPPASPEAVDDPEAAA